MTAGTPAREGTSQAAAATTSGNAAAIPGNQIFAELFNISSNNTPGAWRRGRTSSSSSSCGLLLDRPLGSSGRKAPACSAQARGAGGTWWGALHPLGTPGSQRHTWDTARPRPSAGRRPGAPQTSCCCCCCCCLPGLHPPTPPPPPPARVSLSFLSYYIGDSPTSQACFGGACQVAGTSAPSLP